MKTLLRNGLIQLEYNAKIKQNTINIPAVNPSSGTNFPCNGINDMPAKKADILQEKIFASQLEKY